MDIGFKSYMVLKAASLIEGEQERFLRMLLLKDGDEANRDIEIHSDDLNHMNFWRVFFTIPKEEIEMIIDELVQKKMLYSKTVQVGGSRSSMLLVTGKGKRILYRLDKKYYSIIDGYTLQDNGGTDIIREKAKVAYLVFNYELSQAL